MAKPLEDFAMEIAQTPGVLLIDRKYLDSGQVGLNLKDGRRALYFLNLGAFSDGKSETAMGKAFAYSLQSRAGDFDVVIGPPYKGITIASEAVGALWREYDIKKSWAYRRKEAKEHGEKGAVVGAKLKDGNRLWMADDVITSAKTKIDEKDWFHEYAKSQGEIHLPLNGLTVAVDREQTAVIGGRIDEGGKQLSMTAAQYFKYQTNLPIDVVLGVSELMEYLHDERIEDAEGNVVIDDAFMGAFGKYQREFGAK